MKNLNNKFIMLLVCLSLVFSATPIFADSWHKDTPSSQQENALPKQTPYPTNKNAPSPEIKNFPPEIAKETEKAQSEQNADVSILEGHWRYDKIFVDPNNKNEEVFLDFHLDQNGTGTSMIGYGTDHPTISDAQVFTVDDGAIRIRTSNYVDSNNKEYFPTFLECRPDADSNLDCSMSNGWLHMEHGKFLSISSLKKTLPTDKKETLPPIESEEFAHAKALSLEEKLALLEKSKKNSLKKQSATDKTIKEGEKLIIPKDTKSMNFLEGTWRCETGLVNAKTKQPIVEEFSFDKDGHGQAITKEQSGEIFTASATAVMENGKLKISTSKAVSDKSSYKYVEQYIECTQGTSEAICNGQEATGATWSGVKFFKIK